MSPLSPELLAELQADYISTFPEKIRTLENFLGQKDRLALYEFMHKLAGSGATYMMPEISLLCSAGEIYLKSGKPLNPDLITQVVMLLIEILMARAEKKEINVAESEIYKELLAHTK